MKKLLAVMLAIVMVLSLAPAAFAAGPDYSGYTIRIYSNSNSTERVTWLVNEAKKAGFSISLDTNEVISGDTAAVQAANEKKDGDLIFGLNETRWGQIVDGQYENIKLVPFTPDWADEVGEYKYDNQAYGIVIQNVLMLYRNDEFGTKGQELHFKHWADVVDSRTRSAAPPTPTSTPPCSTPSPIPPPPPAASPSMAGRPCGSSALTAFPAATTTSTALIL